MNLETLGKADSDDHIRHEASKGSPREISYLVDMAKVEALDQMGESQAAIELAERHLT